MNVIDLSEIRVLRRQLRRAPEVPTYTVLMVENLTIAELAHRLRGTGLAVSNRYPYLVLHEAPEPHPAA